MQYPLRDHSEQTDSPSIWTRRVAHLCFLIGLFLAISGLLMLVWFEDYAYFFFLLMLSFVTPMWLIAAILLKAKPIVTVVLASLGLTILSFVYQPHGPELSCFAGGLIPVRGGGFPVQYVIDVPGITYMDYLSFEDDFRLWSFIADICFYVCLVSLMKWIIQYLRRRETGPRARAS